MKKSFARKLMPALIAVLFSAAIVLMGYAMALTAPKVAHAATSNYKSDYASKQESINAGARLNEQIAQEGMVLLKNNGVLPLSVGGKGTSANAITVFGYKSVKPDGGGNAESGETSGGIVRLSSDIYSSLTSAGYLINPIVKDAFNNWADAGKTGDTAIFADAASADSAVKGKFDATLAKMKESYSSFNAAAIVVIGAESLASGDTATRVHSKRLSAGQKALIAEAKTASDNVIVLVNSSVPLELNELKTDADIDAILIVGEPGDNGFVAVGEILKGAVNPSGRLTDTYAVDFTKDPTYINFNTTGAGFGYQQYLKEDGTTVRPTSFVDYEEGIYVGYRYYETRFIEEGANGAAWYSANVAYPFGFGLSYTSFSKSIVSSSPANNAAITKNSKITVEVEVENTGSVAGKEVVQLYFTSPYSSGGIEKAHVVLGDFAKTKILAPGESEIVKLTLDAKDMASYDYKTDKTYVLDAGSYNIRIMNNAHDEVSSLTYTVGAKALCDTSTATGNEIKNRFDDVNDAIAARTTFTSLSRSNIKTWAATKPTAAEATLSDEEYKAWIPVVDATYDTGKPWAATTAPTVADPATRPATAETKLDALIGKGYDSPLWDKLLDQLSYDEMKNLIENGGFKSISIPYIGKPSARDTDGPKGWTGSGVGGSSFNKFAAAPVIAATYNKELAYDLGKLIGDQGLWGSSDRTDGSSVETYSGWYAPAMNTHRSPFDGRYAEYFSEDGYLAGMIAANTSLGVKSKGGYVYIKHFAIHEDGGGVSVVMLPTPPYYSISGYRGGAEASSGLSVWANEQAMREVHFKSFRLAVEKGYATAAMSSFSRIGKVWAGGSYALLTEILRDEWGFKGAVVTDICIYGFLNADQMIRAGGDFVLSSGSQGKLSASKTPTQLMAMRKATKNVLYMVVNSNAMQIPKGAAMSLKSGELANAQVDKTYTNSITATQNTLYAFSTPSYAVTSGILPAGLSMASNGEISGKPTKAGEYTFTITASAAGYASSAAFTIIVDAEKTDIEIINEKLDELENGIGEDINSKIEDTNAKVAGVNTLVVISLIIGVLGLLAAAASVVMIARKK